MFLFIFLFLFVIRNFIFQYNFVFLLFSPFYLKIKLIFVKFKDYSNSPDNYCFAFQYLLKEITSVGFSWVKYSENKTKIKWKNKFWEIHSIIFNIIEIKRFEKNEKN